MCQQCLRSILNRLLVPLTLMLLLAACQPIVAPTALEMDAAVPRYEPAECKYATPEGDPVECGYLTVLEDRSQPDGPTIRLYVVNMKSRGAYHCAGPDHSAPWRTRCTGRVLYHDLDGDPHCRHVPRDPRHHHAGASGGQLL